MTQSEEATERHYIKQVRRYRPSDLVPAVAAIASRYADRDTWRQSPGLLFNPWALADITRVSLSRGNEYRAASTVSERDVLECARLYGAFVGSDLTPGDFEQATRFLIRTTSLQMPYQQIDINHMARAVAILCQTSTEKELKVILPGWDLHVFGCSVTDYIGVGQFLAWAGPAIDPESLNDEIAAVISPDVMRGVISRNYTTDAKAFRLESAISEDRESDPELRRFTYNPLLDKPVIKGISDQLAVPVPQAVLRKLGMLGIFHIATDPESGFGDAFAVDLGHLFEQYIGNQLNLIPGATVISEIEYGKKGAKSRSIDWIVLLPSAVLLIEVKSARPTDPIRLATHEVEERLTEKLRWPFEQIQRTEKQITDGTPEFAGIPIDRPHIGLAVTLEPFDFMNAPGVREMYRPKMTIPSALVSAKEIETMVCVDADIGQLLLDHVTNELDFRSYEATR